MSGFSTLNVSVTGGGARSPILVKSPKDDFKALLNAYVTGTVTYDIEYTLDAGVSPQYIKLGDLDRTAHTDDAFYFPVASFRVNITAGTGTVDLYMLYKD